MPDDIERPARRQVSQSQPQLKINVASDLSLFAQRLPAWCGAHGMPLSWNHYVVGLRGIRREISRSQRRQFDAIAMAFASKEQTRREWLEEINDCSEW